MKKLLTFIIISVFIFSVGCKKDKDDDGNALAPKKDSSVYPGYEEFYSDDQSDIEKNVVVENNNNTETDTTSTKNDSPVMVEDTTGNIQPATNKDLKQNGKDFYIIVGSYEKNTNAQKRKKYFKKIGYAAEILRKHGKYNRVSIAKFNDEKSARDELKILRNKFNDNSYWLLFR